MSPERPTGGAHEAMKRLEAAQEAAAGPAAKAIAEFAKAKEALTAQALEAARVAVRTPTLESYVLPEITMPTDGNLASEFYKRLADWIQRFDASLDNDHEVGVRLVTFGQSVTFHLDDMSYWNPSLISFTGVTEQGAPVELIQHVSQISILLLKVERVDPTKPKNPLGFAVPAESDPTTPESE